MSKVRYRFNCDAMPDTISASEVASAFVAFIEAFNLIITPEAYYKLSDAYKKYWMAFEKEEEQ